MFKRVKFHVYKRMEYKYTTDINNAFLTYFKRYKLSKMKVNLTVTQKPKTYLDKECESVVFAVSYTPHDEDEDVFDTMGNNFIFSLYSKNRSDVFAIPIEDYGVNISDMPTSIFNGEIHDITWAVSPLASNDFYITGFKFKPNKDSITKVGFTSIGSSGLNLNYRENTYESPSKTYYHRKSAGNVFNVDFGMVTLDYFKNIRNLSSDIIKDTKDYVTVPYFCRTEKCILKSISESDFCIESCNGESVTDIAKSYYILMLFELAISEKLYNNDYDEKEWLCVNKMFNILEVLNCCNKKCNEC